jgi:tRNA dimethylallyltransferase
MGARIWLIAGPTASGKSALALRLAQAIGGEIVGADSMQIYRGLEVLTAAPNAEDEARVRHHLVGNADPAEAWSVGRWLAAALTAIGDIQARGRTPIVVGGTGLYFRALTAGLAPAPPVPRAVRDAAHALYDHLGEAAFRARLGEVDPRSAARIGAGDRQRLTRAYEVFAAGGHSLSDAREATAPALGAHLWRGVVLEPPREALYRRCEARLERMIGGGALDEIRALLAQGLAPGLPAMKAMGARPLAAHLAGEISLDEALALAKTETRRYAKRQLTWLRHQAADWPRLLTDDPEAQWAALAAMAGVIER